MIPVLVDAEASYMILTKTDADNLLATLNRALNTWDPSDRPPGILDLADALTAKLEAN